MAYPPQPPPYDPNQPPPVSGPPYPQQPYPAQPYPQQVPYGYQPPPPARPVSPRLAFWTSGQGIVCIFLIAGVAVAVLVGIVNAVSGPAAKNFKAAVTSCEATGSTLPTATIGLTVTNTSDRVRSATVKVEYRDGAGNRIDTDTAYVRNIAPGDTARTEESTILDAAPSGTMRCEIVGVS